MITKLQTLFTNILHKHKSYIYLFICIIENTKLIEVINKKYKCIQNTYIFINKETYSFPIKSFLNSKLFPAIKVETCKSVCVFLKIICNFS